MTNSNSSHDPTTAAGDELDRLLVAASPRRRRLLVVAVSLCVVLVAASLVLGERRTRGPALRTEPIEQSDLTATVSATGQLAPTHQVDVGSELSGTITEILVDSNDTVRAGQVLARLDTSTLEREIERARAALQVAEARLAEARTTAEEAATEAARYERIASAPGDGLLSQSELDAVRAASQRAHAAAESAAASVREAAAALRAKESDLAKTVIRSPIDGLVLERGVEPGQTVAAALQAPVLFTIAEDLSRMELTVDVAEADVGVVTQGQRAHFTVDAWPGEQFEAVVHKVSFGSRTVANVVSYAAELEVANDALRLRPGMTATATIEVAHRDDALVVPNAALRFNPPVAEARRGGFSVLPRPPSMPRRADADTAPGVWVERAGAMERVAVEPGLSDGRRTEVVSGALRAGERVVLEVLRDVEGGGA
ncbi:MAG: efflux RND transporter periplasmic adaptor subunit [Acidobacteriota bacterium]